MEEVVVGLNNKVQQQKYLHIYPFIVSYNEHVVYTDLHCRMFADLLSKDSDLQFTKMTLKHFLETQSNTKIQLANYVTK